MWGSFYASGSHGCAVIGVPNLLPNGWYWKPTNVFLTLLWKRQVFKLKLYSTNSAMCLIRHNPLVLEIISLYNLLLFCLAAILDFKLELVLDLQLSNYTVDFCNLELGNCSFQRQMESSVMVAPITISLVKLKGQIKQRTEKDRRKENQWSMAIQCKIICKSLFYSLKSVFLKLLGGKCLAWCLKAFLKSGSTALRFNLLLDRVILTEKSNGRQSLLK